MARLTQNRLTKAKIRSGVLVSIWLLSVPTLAATITWDGGGTGLASDSSCWDLSRVPTNTDDVVFDGGGGTGDDNVIWDAGVGGVPDTVASWDQESGYDGTVTVQTVYSSPIGYDWGDFTNFTVTGNMTINGGAMIHYVQSSPPDGEQSAERHRLRVIVGGDLTVGASAIVYADGLGYGNGGTYNCSYGGKAGYDNSTTYGTITAPTNIGSGTASSDGGGNIWFTVTGSSTIDGTITAQGEKNGDSNQCGSSGGGIFLQTGTLAGSGVIRADGGYGYNGRGGGGGRIAVVLTNGTTFGSITMSAYGGTNAGVGRIGAAGTVYLEKSTDTQDQGELIVDNRGIRAQYQTTTDLSGVNSVTYQFARLTLGDAAVIQVGPDDTLILSNAVISAVATNGEEGMTSSSTYTYNDENGIRLIGGTLLVDDPFTITNYFISIGGTNCTFDAPSGLTVGQYGKLYANSPHTFSGDLTLTSGTNLTHTRNYNDYGYKIDLTIGGNLTIPANCVVDVDLKGLANAAPGPGGSHAGRSSSAAGTIYGSVVEPTAMGDGCTHGNKPGGGAIKLTVAGTTTLNGIMTSIGSPCGDVNAVPAPGGSIWLTTSSLVGSGTIKANGSGNSRAASGGRVAVVLTGSESFGSVDIQAAGGNWGGTDGAAGTIYQKYGTTETLYINNTNNSTATNVATILPIEYSGSDSEYLNNDDLHQATVRLQEGAQLTLSDNLDIGDLYLEDANTVLDLNYKTLYIRSYEHSLAPGTVTNYGAIVWLPQRGSIVLTK